MHISTKSFLNNSKSLFIVSITFSSMVIASVLGICLGVTSISLTEMVEVISSGNTEDPLFRILLHIRLPRVFGALLSGCALAVSGAIIQAVLNNPLAGPNIIGINAGAGFFVLLSLVFLPSAYYLLPFFAFLGALLTTMIIMLIAVGANVSRLTVVLAGFAISSIFTAGMNTIMILYPDVYVGAGTFLVGGLAALTLSGIFFPSIYISIALIFAMLFSRDLNIISLGADTAKSLGMNVKAARMHLMALAAVLAGAAVSFAGLLGFVGLVVPHAVRFLIGNDNRFVIPASAFLGGTFVIVCDLIARMAFRPYELPVGIIMAFIGGPFFIYLIIRHRRKSYD